MLNPDMPAADLRLHMGEITEQEARTARAAIRWANAEARAELDRMLVVVAAAQDLYDNRLGWSDGRNPYAHTEFWERLNVALSSSPKVLAVVDGWAWPDMADFTYSPCTIAQVPDGPGTRQLPVTAIIIERSER